MFVTPWWTSTGNVFKKKTKSGNETFIASLALDSRTVAAMVTLKKNTQTTLKTKQGLSSFCNRVCCKTRCQTSQRTERPWVMRLHWGSYADSLNVWSVWEKICSASPDASRREKPAGRCNHNRVISCPTEQTCFVSVLAAHNLPEFQLRHKANGTRLCYRQN